MKKKTMGELEKALDDAVLSIMARVAKAELRDLASKAVVNRTTIYDAYFERTSPSVRTLRKIARAFDQGEVKPGKMSADAAAG